MRQTSSERACWPGVRLREWERTKRRRSGTHRRHPSQCDPKLCCLPEVLRLSLSSTHLIGSQNARYCGPYFPHSLRQGVPPLPSRPRENDSQRPTESRPRGESSNLALASLWPASIPLTHPTSSQFNIALLRDVIILFTATGAARGVSGHTGGGASSC